MKYRGRAETPEKKNIWKKKQQKKKQPRSFVDTWKERGATIIASSPPLSRSIVYSNNLRN